MTRTAERRALIDRIRSSADAVRQAVDAVGPAKRAVAPRAGEWSVLETLVHLRNVVTLAYGLRIRRLLYEDAPVFADYDEARAREATLRQGPTTDRLVGMIVAEHHQIAGLLEELPDDQWGRAGRHPDLGEMTVEFLARRVADHADEHAAQIRQTAAAVMEQARRRVRGIAREALERGDATGWFETVYATARGDAAAIPWVSLRPNRPFQEWVAREGVAGSGQHALVVGCGTGDDAEALAGLGFQVTAFDIAPSAIEWCRQRVPGSPVRYVVADVLAPPGHWREAFDFVLEAFTLQVLGADLRERAIRSVAGFVRPGGRLFVVARGRDPAEDPGSMPWPLTREELGLFERAGLEVVRFEDYRDAAEEPPVRRFRVEYRRPTA